MNAQRVQLFLRLSLVLAGGCVADASDSKVYPLKFSDVDGNQISTSDGHMTVLVFATSGDLSKAETVGDRIPDFCLGNAAQYRMVTVVEAKTHSSPIQHAFQLVARHRLDAAAKRLQVRYDNHKIARTARQDVFATIDFGGPIAANFAGQSEAANFRVVVLGPTGELRQQWNDVPTTEQLAGALK